MRIFVSALLAFVILFLSSCQQEPDVILDDVTPDPSADSMRLLQYIELDTTQLPGLDTTSKIVYTYDTQKRVTRSEMTFSITGDETIEYFYNGNDSLPNKYIYHWSDASSDYIDTIFVSHANGVVSRDSSIEYKITTGEFYGTIVHYFIPEGNNMKIINRDYDLPGLTPLDGESSGTLIQTRVNGNITSQDDTAAFPVAHFDRAHQTASYDNKINPFYRLEIRYPVLGYNVTSQRNNLIEEKVWDDPAFINSHTFCSYTYRADGYPLTVIKTQDDNNSFMAKGIFVYSH